MGISSLFSAGANLARRSFFKQVASVVAAAAGARLPIAPPEPEQPLLSATPETPKALNIDDAVNCIHELRSNLPLMKQIVYAARAAHAAKMLLVNHLRSGSLGGKFYKDISRDLEKAALPHALQFAVSLELSGALQAASGKSITAALPFQADPLLVHTARIAALGIESEDGLRFPLLAPVSAFQVELAANPDIAMRLLCRSGRGENQSERIKEICADAVSRGLSPDDIPAFCRVFNEREELIAALEERGAPMIADPIFSEDLGAFSCFALHGSKSSHWRDFLNCCGSVLGLAVNLPLTLEALRVYENPDPLAAAEKDKVMQAILDPTLQNLEWLRNFPLYQTLLRVQMVLEGVSNPYHPPPGLVLRHGQWLESAARKLQKGGFHPSQIASPLSSVGREEVLPTIFRKRKELVRLLSQERKHEKRSPVADSFPQLQPPDIRVLSSISFNYPFTVLLDGKELLEATRQELVELWQADKRIGLWRRWKPQKGPWRFREETFPNLTADSGASTFGYTIRT